MKEINIEFEYKTEKIKQKFLDTNELYKIYGFCAKKFECGIFDLFYNEINLRFVDKNYKINQIINENNNNILFKIIPENKKNVLKDNIKIIDKNYNFYIDKNNKLYINKGEISNLILLNNLYNKKINYIILF